MSFLFDLSLELVSIWIENERGVVRRTVSRSKPWRAIIAPAIDDRGRVKGIHRRPAGCNQREMKARACSKLYAGFGPQKQGDLSPG